MSYIEKHQGRCLCGACTFEATPREMKSSVCHCVICRRWAGVQFSVDVGSDLSHVEGPVSVYPSSPHMNRYSCELCSAPLYREVVGQDQYYVIMQCFDDPSNFPLAIEIFIDEKPASYALEGDHPRLTGNEFRAMQVEKEG